MMDDILVGFIYGALAVLYGEYRVWKTRKRWAAFTRTVVKALNNWSGEGKRPQMTELVFDGVVVIDPDEEGATVQ